MSKIKTALERFQAYCASKGILEKSSLSHIHKISQFEDHERKELRTAYEALQKENAELKEESQNYENASRIAHEWNMQIGLANGELREANAAQAKRIEELEAQIEIMRLPDDVRMLMIHGDSASKNGG